MKTFINGPKSPYIYSTKIANTNLAESTTFTELYVQVYDIQESIIGSGKEKFEMWFDDLTVIQDLANNSLSDCTMIGNLNRYIYISPEVLESTERSGSSIKYTFISIFSINMLIKLFVSSSASIMWSLMHVLQVFRFILMINIKMPRLISMTIDYLGVVIGEIEELDELIPDIYNEYVIDSEELNTDAIVLERFEENGYEKPYLTDLYGKQAFTFSVIIAIWIPCIYLLLKISRGIPKLNSKLARIWNELFWNTPLRTFTELFIEISLGFFLHSLNVSILQF